MVGPGDTPGPGAGPREELSLVFPSWGPSPSAGPSPSETPSARATAPWWRSSRPRSWPSEKAAPRCAQRSPQAPFDFTTAGLHAVPDDAAKRRW